MKIYDINKNEFSFSAIYLLVNLINNKVYVGQAQNLYLRMLRYKNGFESKRMIGKAINKYGINNFDIILLEKDIPIEDLNDKEQYWMDFYKSYDLNIGYNLCCKANSTKGYVHTSKSKQKMREKALQRYKDNPNLKLYGDKNGMYGKHHNDEAKKKISNHSKLLWQNDDYRNTQVSRMLGKNNHMYGVHLYGDKNGMYGKHHNDETKQIISNKAKERWENSKNYNKLRKKIICIETNKIYNSLAEAARDLNILASGISNNLHGRSGFEKYKGYSFKFIE